MNDNFILGFKRKVVILNDMRMHIVIVVIARTLVITSDI